MKNRLSEPNRTSPRLGQLDVSALEFQCGANDLKREYEIEDELRSSSDVQWGAALCGN